MIEVREVVETEGGCGADRATTCARSCSPPRTPTRASRSSLVPRERFSGVPDYYLLHVTDELQPPSDAAGHAVQLDGVDDQLTVAADPSLDIRRKLTVELWFKVDSLDFGSGNVWMPLVYKGDKDSPSAAERSYSLWLNSAGYLHFTSANGSQPGRRSSTRRPGRSRQASGTTSPA